MLTATTQSDISVTSRTGTGKLPAVDWRERKELARVAFESLADGIDSENAIDLLRRLACDEKWEVRLAVAERLLAIPDDEFPWFAERLAKDNTSFVRVAAGRAVSRHQRSDRELNRRKKETEQVERQMQRLEAEFGRAAMITVLRMCDRRVEQLVGPMVHDLRGILTFLKASCHAVLSDPKSRQKKARLSDHLALLENMINDMESFTRPAPAARCPERLHDVIAAAIDVVKENVRKCQLDPSPVTVQLDVCEGIVLPMVRHLVLMAFVNVIKNAYESFATGPEQLGEGEICIRSKRTREFVSVVIVDNGIGMAEDELTAVASFRPGRRNKSKRYSTGFGLPIASRNLAAHDGTIEIDSRHETGTTVTITLPLKSNDEEQRHEPKSFGRRGRSANC